MQLEAPLTVISPLRAGRGEVERTPLGSLFGDPDTVPPKGSPLPLEKGEGQGEGLSRMHDTAKRSPQLFSLHLQQRAVATESRAERRHPPQPAGRVVRQRRLQDKQHKWAAEVAKFAQHNRTPAQIR